MSVYRQFYSYTLEDFVKFNSQFVTDEYLLNRTAKRHMRMIANLFNRDMRKEMINKRSVCACCGSTNNLTIDHIIPISRGGKNERSNVQVLCEPCNLKKGADERV